MDIWSIGCILGELSDGQPVFPGESEIDQLYVIQKIIGPLPAEQMHLFNSNPRFRGLKFPSEIKPLSLKRKYHIIIPPDLLSFMEATLQLEPKKRLKIAECSQHRAFDQNRKEKPGFEDKIDDSEDSWKEIQLEDPSTVHKQELNNNNVINKTVTEKPEAVLEHKTRTDLSRISQNGFESDNVRGMYSKRNSTVSNERRDSVDKYDVDTSHRTNKELQPSYCLNSKKLSEQKSTGSSNTLPKEHHKQLGKLKNPAISSGFSSHMISAGNMDWSHGNLNIGTQKFGGSSKPQHYSQQFSFLGPVSFLFP